MDRPPEIPDSAPACASRPVHLPALHGKPTAQCPGQGGDRIQIRNPLTINGFG
jgi:hypothetical protein